MTDVRTALKDHLPTRKLFEANFPMFDHICDGWQYRLERKEDTGREVGGRSVIAYVFVLGEKVGAADIQGK